MKKVGLRRAKAACCLLPLLITLACAQGTSEREAPSFSLTAPKANLPDEHLVDDKPAAETPLGKHGALKVVGPDLVDAHGKPVQLKGISSMWLNMEETGYAESGAALKWMRDNWNVSLFRAAMGVGNDQGQASGGGYLVYPDRMQAFVDRIIENATTLGMYVLVDWHDHVAEYHVDQAEAFFSDMAQRYKDHDNVIYEVFNEPITGIWDQATRTVKQSFTWADDIKPYHERVVAAIRRYDPDAVIVLGTPQWSQKVDTAAEDPVAGTNLMYTLHFYSCTHKQQFRDIAQVARDAGLPIMVTEWGATNADGGVSDKTVCSDEGDLWQQWMNTNNISWAAWKLDDCTDASCLLKPGTAVTGDWSKSLQGHGQYVVDKLLAPTSPSAPSPSTSTPAPSASPMPSAPGPAEADGGAEPNSTSEPATSGADGG
ncbi:MAG TPA: glycoside hydrolase family 5 protein [Polyangiaceae bacterium]|jgi:endoglucanase|nr:glycoside hydrolase family 5 protein [Polyangiaceae bacterium]